MKIRNYERMLNKICKLIHLHKYIYILHFIKLSNIKKNHPNHSKIIPNQTIEIQSHRVKILLLTIIMMIVYIAQNYHKNSDKKITSTNLFCFIGGHTFVSLN